jgi:squalene-hopene/tetraprenyl-beta-curcumene cyclase
MNAGYGIEALRASGIPANDEAMQRALKFMQRCQNLSGVNDQPYARNGTQDGGGVYSPDSSKSRGSYHDGSEGEKPKEEQKPGQAVTLESYGTATYMLIQSYLALDLAADDPRVQAALGWIKRNYRLDANAGMPAGKEREGLFYQYVLMAKTFSLLGLTEIEVEGKGKVDWRADLYRAAKEHATAVAGQTDQVFWLNSASRWGEGIPQLTTAYTIRALAKLRSTLPAAP